MESIVRAIDKSKFLSQLIPLLLTFVVLVILVALLHSSIVFFNLIPFSIPIILKINPVDVLVGATIYLKTSIDFAILMGRLMSTYPGWRNRVAIEIGTALGNALGTIVIIGLWVIFKHIDILLGLMVFVASLVLFELAHGSLDHIDRWKKKKGMKRAIITTLHTFLDAIKVIIDPVLSRVMPDLGEKLKGKKGLKWMTLISFSMSVPFVLGLDDFAGYVPLFNVVNVYGFSIGVLSAHTLLNIFLFISPRKTIQAVKNEYISLAGAIAFIGLAIYGLVETVKIIAHALGS